MGGKSSTISNSEQRILSLQVQQSSQGLTLPVVYGRARVAGNLICYTDFVAIEHRTEQRAGKGGGGTKMVDIKYTYEAAVMMALCEGEIKGVVSVWRDKEKFQSAAQLRLNVYKGGRDQALWPHLKQAKHADKALNYSGTAYVCSPNYQLTNSAQIYNHNFEVDGKLGYSADIPDANPRDILADLLANEEYGCGFPADSLGDLEVYSTYCRANGLFLSPVFNEQTEAHSNIADLLEQTNSAAVFSEGRLKIVPYGDAPVSGNGAFYVPNLTPLYDLTDDDFIGSSDPVQAERKTNADAFNQVEVEFLDRANDYNIAVVQAKDQANIEQFGLRPKDTLKMHGICDKSVAQQVAQLVLQRSLYVRNEYSFRLGWKYILLEPMDLVTLTDKTLGLDKTPVRIIEIEEDEDGVLNVKAEDFPFGTATAANYPSQESSGYAANYNIAPGNAHAPAVFEAPLQLTGGEPEIWLATGGGDNWGGAEVWVSTDGDSYIQAGVISSKARYGTLQGRLKTGAAYDNANILDVQLNHGQLKSASEDDARSNLTACWLDGEFIGYQTADLSGVSRYRLSKLVRGLYGSDINAHEAGSGFVRLDEALFKYGFDKNWLGKTVWIKLVSFNVFGSGLQDISEVPAYPYTIKGAPLGQVQNLRLTSDWAFGKNASIAWDKTDGADSYDVEVYAATSQTPLRVIEGLNSNIYTYSAADMQADGGQTRDVVFKVRARAVTGKTGSWTQLAARNPQLKALQGIALESGLNQAFFQCTAPDEEDFAGIRIWLSEQAACPATDGNLAYDGKDTFVTLNKCGKKPLESGKTYYVRAAGYDSFDKNGLNISSSVAFTVYDVNAVAKDLSESNLAAALKGRLNMIDGNGAGSVNARLQDEARARASAITEEAGKQAQALQREVQARTVAIGAAADEFTAKLGGEIGKVGAKYDEEVRKLKQADQEGLQWRQAYVAKNDKAVADVVKSTTVLTNNLSSLTEHYNRLQSNYNGTKSKLENLETSLANGTHAVASKLNALHTEHGKTKANLTNLSQSLSNGTHALARRLNTMEAKAQTTATELSQFKTAQAEADKAQTAEIDTAKSEIGSNKAEIETLKSTKADSTQVVAIARSGLSAEWQSEATKARNAAVAAAASDAQRKADAAKTAAERTAQAKADAAKAQAKADAATDAQRKADAAKAAAVQTASADAQAKADAAKRAAETAAQAKADAAKAAAIADAAAKDALLKQQAAADAQAKADKAKEAAVAEARKMVEPVGARVDRLEQTSVTRTQAEALAEEKIRAKFQKPDTRNDNRPPSWYWENYPRQTASEFKTARALGLGGGFCVLETNVPWGNASGGAITQTAYKDDGTVQRRKSDTAHTYANGVYTYTRDTWTEWVQDETVKGAQAKADAVKRIADEAAKIARKAEADFKTFTSTYTSDKEAAAHRETELKAKIANIKGGRNYLEDSGFTRGLFGFSQGATNGSAKVSDGVVTITSPTATWRQWQIHGKAGSRANNANSSAVLETLQAGETYTLSFWARAVSGSPRIWTRLRENRTGGLGTVEQMSFDVTPTRDWQRFEQSFTVTSDTAKHDFWRVILATSDVGTVEFKQPMLQLGVQAADWQPAPEDISASVKTVSDAQVRADGRVSAMHTLQVNANGHIAGIGLQSDIEAGRAVSRLIFQADRVGFASGNLQTFPFTVDTQRNQVGIDGTMIVNGKAVIDRLASGDIVGDKIKANSLNANRLTAGSITSRELKAGAVTADKISANVITGNHIAAGQSLRSPSINAGSINGGNINIGNGQFMVDNNGVMTANAGVFKGRIEAEDGFFNGTVRADKIEGDVLKVLRMRRTIEGGTVSYSLAIPAAKRALMLKLDDFKFLLPDDRYTRIKVMINELLYREFGGGRGSVTAITPWLPFPANQEIRLEITANPVSEHGLLLGDVYSAGYPTVSVRFMDDSDPVMQSLNGDLVWLKVPASKLIHIEYVAAGAIYWLPPDIYGIRTANGGVHGLSLYSRYGLMYQHPSTSKGRKWTHLFAVPETLKANIPKVLVDSLEVLTWRGRIF